MTNPLVKLLNDKSVRHHLERRSEIGLAPAYEAILGLTGHAQVDCALGHVKWAIGEISEGTDDYLRVSALFDELKSNSQFQSYFREITPVNGSASVGGRKSPGYSNRNGRMLTTDFYPTG